MKDASAAMIWCPFPDADTAETVARNLLEENLVACANILPGVSSVYRWKGRIETGDEVGVLFKTTQASLENATIRLEQLHPYETPAIMGWPVSAAPPATLAWLVEQMLGEDRGA